MRESRHIKLFLTLANRHASKNHREGSDNPDAAPRGAWPLRVRCGFDLSRKITSWESAGAIQIFAKTSNSGSSSAIDNQRSDILFFSTCKV